MRTRHRRLPVPKFKCRALIVDDVEDKLYFAYLGWEVRLASNGAEGLAMARAEHPDILVLDLPMPGMDGWEVGQHLKDARNQDYRCDWPRTAVFLTSKVPRRRACLIRVRRPAVGD